MDYRPQNHPGRELAAADKRPATRHAIAVLDDLRLTRGARAVGGDDVRIAMDGVRRLGRELRRGPVRIAIPHAPRDRGISLGKLLEDCDALHRR
jgi:hypothetical protein